MNFGHKQDYDALRSEYAICKRKLDSKCEALLILSGDLDKCRQERDQFKLMAEQVQQRYQALKRQLAGVGPRLASTTEYSGMKQHNLQQLLYEMRESNKALQFEVDDLKQKHKDAQGDIKLLREQIARQRVGTTDEGMNTRHFPAHEREDLVKQLESAREQVHQMERDLQQVLDEKEEQETERDVYKNKYERLNHELNYILKGDEKRIVDIDALSMENKYLHERLKQMEEEKTMAMATVSKYKSILERKKNKGILKLGQSRSGGVVISQKQVQQLLEDNSHKAPTQQMVTDLQSLCTALLESVNDKNLALSHQRKTNKILGTRVAELEKKMKTFEVAGLWNFPGHSPSGSMDKSLDKLRSECEDLKTLIPRQLSAGADSTGTGGGEDASPSDVRAAAAARLAGLMGLEDLDLLPTKEHRAAGSRTSNTMGGDVLETAQALHLPSNSNSPTKPNHDSAAESSAPADQPHEYANEEEEEVDLGHANEDVNGADEIESEEASVEVQKDEDLESQSEAEVSDDDESETLENIDLTDGTEQQLDLEGEEEEEEGEEEVETKLQALLGAASDNLVNQTTHEQTAENVNGIENDSDSVEVGQDHERKESSSNDDFSEKSPSCASPLLNEDMEEQETFDTEVSA